MKGFNIHISGNQINTNLFFENDYDSFVFKNDEVEIAIEGIILNKQQLLQNSSYSNFSDFFINLYQNKNINSIKELDGEFRGFVWDKLNHKVFIFTNPTSTQRVFYTKQNGQIFIDSHLVRLTESLKKNNIPVTPNINNLYKLLTF